MSESRWRPDARMSLQVLVLLVVELAEHPLEQHLGEADDRVERRAQLVRHVGEELATCAGWRPRAAGSCPRSRGTAARSGWPGPTGWRTSAAARRRAAAKSPGASRLTTSAPTICVLAEQRHGEQRAVAEAQRGRRGRCCRRRRVGDVGDLDGSRVIGRAGRPRPRPSERRRAQGRRRTRSGNRCGGPQVELLGASSYS